LFNDENLIVGKDRCTYMALPQFPEPIIEIFFNVDIAKLKRKERRNLISSILKANDAIFG